METYQIELSAKELLVIAQITGALVGYAVPDRYWDREVVLNIFNKANGTLVNIVTVNKAAGRTEGWLAPIFTR
jgi:uncharacterized membrane protein